MAHFFLKKAKAFRNLGYDTKNGRLMYYKNYIKDNSLSEKKENKCPELIDKAYEYVNPILNQLSTKMDKRFMYTFFDLFMGMLSFRDKTNALLLSELGGYVNGPKNAPAGTKRISNLLRNEYWNYKDLSTHLLQKTKNRLSNPLEKGKQWLMHWDDSVIEKPESWKSEGLCPVFSSKAGRLTRIKPGYYKKVGRICVPGFEWSGAVLSSLSDTPTICNMQWWTTKGKYKDCRSNILFRMLRETSSIIEQSGAEVWHVFDRGYANINTLEYLDFFKQKFIIRWKSNHLLKGLNGQIKNTFKHSLGKKATSTRTIWDKERKEHRKVSILYMPIRHPELEDKQLYLVIARDKRKGTKPIYFLTDVPVDTNGMAWCILRSYMRRWDVEQVFRFGKTAMGIESPRLWFWENKLKLLMILTLVMDFLITLISIAREFSRNIIDTWCPRTGNRQKNTFLPIYRLRLAITLLILYEIVPRDKG